MRNAESTETDEILLTRGFAVFSYRMWKTVICD